MRWLLSALCLALATPAYAAPFRASSCSGLAVKRVIPSQVVFMCNIDTSPAALEVAHSAQCVYDPDTTEDAATTPTVAVRLMTTGLGAQETSVNYGQLVPGSPITPGSTGSIALLHAGVYRFEASGNAPNGVIRCVGF